LLIKAGLLIEMRGDAGNLSRLSKAREKFAEQARSILDDGTVELSQTGSVDHHDSRLSRLPEEELVLFLEADASLSPIHVDRESRIESMSIESSLKSERTREALSLGCNDWHQLDLGFIINFARAIFFGNGITLIPVIFYAL
jgi:hypothetical protein